MSIPPFHVFMRPCLDQCLDGSTYSLKQFVKKTQAELKISDEDANLLLKSGRETILKNRVAWALQYLFQAGLIHRPQRAHYQVTEKGKEFVARHSGPIKPADLMVFDSFRVFSKGGQNREQSQNSIETESPIERLENAISEINESLESELLQFLKTVDPFRFEQIVVDLMIALGYGDSFDNAGTVTQRSGDGGIDGVIKLDKLGLDNVCLQAKRFNDSTIGSTAVQNFVGALSGWNANRGVFITTSRFSSQAIDYVKNLGNTKVVLIDGSQLVRLMVEHNLGVSIVKSYHQKAIDTDYFD